MAIAHVAHAELRVTDLEASRDFFTRVMGLFVSHEDDDHVFLRAWQDWDHHTLVLTRAPVSGLEHVAWRVDGPEALGEFEAQLKGLGIETSWVEGGSGVSLGHGDALRFLSPAGVPTELFWEVDKYVEKDRRCSRSCPAIRSATPAPASTRGASTTSTSSSTSRRASRSSGATSSASATTTSSPATSATANSGSPPGWRRRTSRTRSPSCATASRPARCSTTSPTTSTPPTRWCGRRRSSPTPARRSNGARPQHGTSGAIFLYCIEPSGNRVEVWSGGFLLFAPDWEAIHWDPEVSPLGLELWGSDMPDTYLRYGTALGAPATAPQPA